MDGLFGRFGLYRKLRGGHWEVWRYPGPMGMSAAYLWTYCPHCSGLGWGNRSTYCVVLCEDR